MSFQQILGRKPENFRDYMQATGQFIFGGNTGDTYETLQQKRQVAGRLAANASRAPKTAGEGLTALGQAIAYRRLMNQANEGEKAGQEDFNEQFQSLLGGAAPMAAPASAVPGSSMSGPAQPQVTQAVASGDDPYAAFNASLARTESGGNYNITNSEGFGGKYQFGQPRLDDFNRAMGTNYRVADLTAGSPEAAALTEAVQRWHIGDIDNFVTDNGLDRYVGQNIGGVTMTQNGLRAMAHLGGTGGMRRFLTSGGQYNPSDSNGTSLLDYARTHAGGAAPSGPGAMPSAPAGGGIDPRLIAMLDNPYATNGQRAVMQLMLQRQMAASAPPDPMQALQMRQAQLGIERSQLELDRLRNPTVDPMQQIELERAQIELEQLRNPQPETTDDIREYQFAQQNGFEGSFSDFIRGNRRAGASSVNVSTGTGLPTPKAGFDYVPDGEGGVMRDERGMPIQAPIPGGPEDTSGDAASLAASASDSLALIDNVLNDPNLASVTGMIQGRLPARTQAQQDLLIRIEQLQGQAFLQAFETLKGGGQITEREGQAAQAAIARLQRPQSEDAYRQALTELRAIVARGAERAGGAAQQPSGTPAGPTHRFNAETGQIEEITQ